MKTILLAKDYKQEAAKLVGQFAAPSHFDTLIDSGRTRVVTLTGETLAFYLPHRIDEALRWAAYRDWRKVDKLPSARPAASGALSLPGIRKDGGLSGRAGTPMNVLAKLKKQGVRTGTLGYARGHRTSLTKQHPGWLSDHVGLFRCVDRLYEEYIPWLYAIQRTAAKKTCHIPHTAFTTAYISKQWRTAYHVDAGNLHGVVTCLIPMGEFEGGELVLPRWRLAFALRPGDLLLFNPQEVHGNLPITGKRLSAAFYCEGS